MKTVITSAAIALMLVPAGSAVARDTFVAGGDSGGSELAAVLQCVPYARQQTGIQIFGDAHSWWRQAEGRYRRGSLPAVGAVMAIRPHANSRLGHVAAVSRIVDSRTVLLRHANWSEPGRIENDVKAIDVSPANDWSQVRIWHGPSQALGTTHWPLYGFIYPGKSAPRAASAPSLTRMATTASRDPVGDIIAGRLR